MESIESFDSVRIYCLPVSGASFEVQLELLKEVYLAKKASKGGILRGYRDYAPDLVFSSSGGNVAAYLALAGDWSPEGIDRSIERVESTMFIKPWIRYLPSWIMAPFTGSLYRPGYGSENAFTSLFTPRSIQRTEIWTGTFEKASLRAQMFCNRSAEESSIDVEQAQEFSFLHGTHNPCFLDGDVKAIARVSMASASIPYVTKCQSIGDRNYADGGVMYATPFSVMSRMLKPISGYFQLVYFCSFNMEDCTYHRSAVPISEIQSLINSNVLQDRSTCIDALSTYGDSIYTHYPKLDTATLTQIFCAIEHCHYVLILYPLGWHKVQLKSFQPCHVRDEMAKCSQQGYGGYLFMVPS